MLGYMARGITVTDGIKVVTKLTLRYLGGPDVVTKVFIRGKPKCSWERREQCDNRSRDWSDAITNRVQTESGAAKSEELSLP